MESIYDSNKKILLSVSPHQSGWEKFILLWCECLGNFLYYRFAFHPLHDIWTKISKSKRKLQKNSKR